MTMRQRDRSTGAVLLLALAVALLVEKPAAAADSVDIALVLAADVSRSVDDDEFRLQREGYADAFKSPQVLRAIQSGPHGAIAVTFIEFAGADQLNTVAEWTVIRDGEGAAVFATRLLTPPRSFAGFTSISAAIDYSMKRFGEGGIKAERRIIDISGDGTNNAGRPVTQARDDALAQGVTINGLTILNLHPNPGFFAHTQPAGGLPNYYRENVIGGPAAFLVEIEDYKSFGQAVISKLIGEIASLPAGRAQSPRAHEEERIATRY
jgi:hypothetical protein